LFHWRNLYIHTQQEWEALNFTVKKYWFRCTNRGGGRGSKIGSFPLRAGCNVVWSGCPVFHMTRSSGRLRQVKSSTSMQLTILVAIIRLKQFYSFLKFLFLVIV
jgi:hypothetical protein